MKDEAIHRMNMHRMGVNDGRKGRPPTEEDPTYLRGYEVGMMRDPWRKQDKPRLEVVQ